MFPFHTVLFTLRLVMVDPCFVTSDDSVQAGVTFFITAIQILLADVQACLFMQHCELFWDQSCTNFVKAKSIVDDFIGRTRLICRRFATSSIVIRLFNRTMSRTRSMLSSVEAVVWRPAPPSHVTLLRQFLNFSIHS